MSFAASSRTRAPAVARLPNTTQWGGPTFMVGPMALFLAEAGASLHPDWSTNSALLHRVVASTPGTLKRHVLATPARHWARPCREPSPAAQLGLPVPRVEKKAASRAKSSPFAQLVCYLQRLCYGASTDCRVLWISGVEPCRSGERRGQERRSARARKRARRLTGDIKSARLQAACSGPCVVLFPSSPGLSQSFRSTKLSYVVLFPRERGGPMNLKCDVGWDAKRSRGQEDASSLAAACPFAPRLVQSSQDNTAQPHAKIVCVVVFPRASVGVRNEKRTCAVLVVRAKHTSYWFGVGARRGRSGVPFQCGIVLACAESWR